uniref:Tetratricopeptide repeat protein n=1 Tax=Timema monikensis TaxID=170555 RepID=A0A7R9E8F4_9NEOP|nr:unnamed protein product [Timema monikensis]
MKDYISSYEYEKEGRFTALLGTLLKALIFDPRYKPLQQIYRVEVAGLLAHSLFCQSFVSGSVWPSLGKRKHRIPRRVLAHEFTNKAESLYHLGDFEHSLMYYHRGLRIRPELEGFRLGIQKAQEAIENTIGSKTVTHHKSQSLPQSQSTASAPLTTEESLVAESKKQTLEAGSLSKTSRPVSNVGQKTSKSLLGELCVDKEYLEQLLRHPDIKCLHQQKASNNIAMFAEEGVAFLNNRQEFWRQQRPSTASSKKMIKKSPHATTNNTRLAC